jgi:hypothetical protein
VLSSIAHILNRNSRNIDSRGSITLTLLLFAVVMTVMFLTILVTTDSSSRRMSHLLEERARASFMAESGFGAALVVLADNLGRHGDLPHTGVSNMLDGLDSADFGIEQPCGFKCTLLEILSASRGSGQGGKRGVIVRIRIEGWSNDRRQTVDRTVTF